MSVQHFVLAITTAALDTVPATLQWHLERTEEAFTALQIQPADQIETYAAVGAK